MPVYLVQIRCELENIESLKTTLNNYYKFDISSGQGHTKEGVTVSFSEEQELDDSKGTANFVCKFEKSMSCSYMKLLEFSKIKGCNGTYTDKKNDWVTIVGVECRGLEITKYIPSIDFDAIASKSNTIFPSIDMTDLEWSEYDEEGDQAVSVMNVETRIVRQ